MKNRPPHISRSPVGSGFIAGLILVGLFAVAVTAADVKTLTGQVPAAVGRLRLSPVGRLPADTRLNLAIGLPMHNRQSLETLFEQLYDPASTNFHHFLTSAEVTERFGPTEQEYQAVIQFAQTNGLRVFATYSNRLLLDVEGQVSDIEKAFHVALRTYQHPVEARQFFAPDADPTVDSGLPIEHISGLDNYASSHPNLRWESMAGAQTSTAGPANGSGPGNNYLGYDFRNAYAPGVSLTGSGQIVGLFEMDGYDANDITAYENLAGISPLVTLQNIVLDGLSGFASGNTNAVAEVSLDIEMAIAMAPGLSKVVVFEGNNWDDILNSMASHSEIKQLSCSWGFGGATDSTMDGIFLTMGLQGQSFLLASGDGDAFTGDLMGPDDDVHITTVGGTALTMNGAGASYSSESVWNWGYSPPSWWYGGGGYWGSGGGISTRSSIPLYQQGISMVSNGGSTTMRNVPDVALTATGIYVKFYHGLAGSFGGTSCAAPLWAGFIALVNQQAASTGQPAVGFLNPAIFQISKGASYSSCFHDVTTGNNTSAGSPSRFYAVTGYDLCTGLGTPNGLSLINALMPYSGYSSGIWVDYNYSFIIQLGSYDFPYSTLAQAVSAVSTGGEVWFRTAGSKVETMTISKPMSIHALAGPATIGH
jgi:subtilase family serine protease